MYLNDKLVDTICADTAKETIEIIKERYGDIEIEVLSQEHLQDAFGVEEFRRLASEIPKRQDEDMGSVPSQVRTEGFPNSAVSPRGHINTDVGLVDKRALNLAKQAARGELSGMEGSGGEVLSEESLPASAEHGVELLGTEFIFYPTEQFELEVSTGSTLMVGSRSTRGDASKAESLMGFNFGAEMNLAGDEAGGEPSSEEVSTEEAPDEEPEEEAEMAEGAGPPGLMEQVNEKIEDLPGGMQAGHVVMSGTPGGRPLIDDAAREVLVEMSDAVESTTRNEATDYEMEIGDLMVFADESKTAVSASGAEQPSYQLRTSENEEEVTAEDIALALKTENFLTQVSGTTDAASLEDTDSEEEPETVGEALSGRAERAAGLDEENLDDDIVPGGFAQTAQGTFVGGDALAILQEVAGETTQSSVTFDLAGKEHVFSIDPAPTKFIETEENGAFRVGAGSDAAEDLTVRGLLMAFEESGAIRRKALSEQIAEPEEEESAGPEPAPEPSAPEPEPTEPEPAGEEEQSAFEETQQKVDNALSVLDDL